MEIEYFDSEEWNPPHEFEGYQLPAWPFEIFPEDAQRFAKEVSRSTETPIEMASMLILSAIATAAMKNFYVEVHRSYQEPLALWTLAILPSGSKKSKVFELIMAPIMAWEEQKRTQQQILTGPQISRKITLEEKVKHLRRKAAQTNNDSSFEEYQKQIEFLEKEIELIFASPQLWTSDVTPEHLGTLMAQNDGAMAILSDEGAIFDVIGGLYSKGKANIDLLLKGHSGGSVKVNRGSRPEVHLERALISMGLAVQPEIIMNICKNKTFRGRGLLGRFLYAFPVSNIGSRTNEEGPIDEAIQLHYNGVIGQILSFQNQGNNPRYKLDLDPAAHKKWQEYSKSIEMMMSPEIGHLTHITDWASKLGGQIIRISALLHIYRHAFDKPWEHKISFEDMCCAVKIGHALIGHALKVFHCIYDEDFQIAKEILYWIKNTNKERFTRRECERSFRRYDVKILKKGLDILKERGFLHESKFQKAKGAPSIILEVNPLLTNIPKGQ